MKTYYRYFDWYITTPTMLMTLVGMMEYFNNPTVSIDSFTRYYKNEIIFILLMNSFMLSYGFLGEINYIKNTTAVILGMVPFLATFAVIFYKFHDSLESLTLAIITFMIWFLYSVAALLDESKKNIMYNVLDLFSKNLFGLFIAIYLVVN
jgi:bacteriorhodopsin